MMWLGRVILRRNEIGGNLGWVNSEECGLFEDIKVLPELRTEWVFVEGQSAPQPTAPRGRFEEDAGEVGERCDDGPDTGVHTCQACGRSTYDAQLSFCDRSLATSFECHLLFS